MTTVNYKKSIEPREWVEQNVNWSALVENVESTIIETINLEGLEDGCYVGYLGDIVSGSIGNYQPNYILRFFDYKVDNMDEYPTEDMYDEVEDFAGEVAKIINEKLYIKTNLLGTFYFGNLEADGSYGSFYQINKDDVPEKFIEKN